MAGGAYNANTSLYEKYKDSGGTFDFQSWMSIGSPSSVETYNNNPPGATPQELADLAAYPTAPGTTTVIPATGSEPEREIYNPLQIGGNASDNLAAVTKSTYQDWKDTYLPIALKMMDETTYKTPGMVKEEVNSAVGGVNAAFNSAQGVRERTASRYGVQFDDQQKAANDRITGLEKSTSVVDAANRIRQRLADRNRTIATGGIPNLAGKDYTGGS